MLWIQAYLATINKNNKHGKKSSSGDGSIGNGSCCICVLSSLCDLVLWLFFVFLYVFYYNQLEISLAQYMYFDINFSYTLVYQLFALLFLPFLHVHCFILYHYTEMLQFVI